MWLSALGRRRPEEFRWIATRRVLLGVLFGHCARRAIGRQGLFGFDIAPCAAVTGHHFIRVSWAPTARGVVREVARGQGVPHVQNWLNDAPACFDHVRALEQSGVADHAVVKKALVTRAVRGSEIARVIKVHVNEAELHGGAGNLRAEAKRNSLVGLDVNDQTVRARVLDRRPAEKLKRRTAELNGNFSNALGQSLSRAEIE